MVSSVKVKAHFVTGPSPIPALTCPDTPELAGARSLRRSRPAQPIALLWVAADRERASPAFSRICPASSLGIL